jgi:hypothetical protein
MDRYNGLLGLDVSTRPPLTVRFHLIDHIGNYHVFTRDGDLLTEEGGDAPLVVSHKDIGPGRRYVIETKVGAGALSPGTRTPD